MSYPRTSKRVESVSTIFGKGKTQIPADVRRLLHVKDGDKLVWYHEEGKIFVERNY